MGEKIVIGEDIVITVVEVHRDAVRLGIDAPRSVPVNRAELLEAVGEENVAATKLSDADAAATLASLRGIKPKKAPGPGPHRPGMPGMPKLPKNPSTSGD